MYFVQCSTDKQIFKFALSFQLKMFYNRAEICLKVSDDDAEDVRERREREKKLSAERKC